MKKNSGKTIWVAKFGIVAYVAMLFGHVLIDHYWEIYPSLVFPGFGNVTMISDSVELTFIDLYGITQENKRVDIPKKDFFESLVSNHAPFLLNTLIEKEKETSKESLARRAQFAIYSKKNLKAIFPDITFDSLYISKYLRTVNVHDGSFSGTKKLQTQIAFAL